MSELMNFTLKLNGARFRGLSWADPFDPISGSILPVWEAKDSYSVDQFARLC